MVAVAVFIRLCCGAFDSESGDSFIRSVLVVRFIAVCSSSSAGFNGCMLWCIILTYDHFSRMVGVLTETILRFGGVRMHLQSFPRRSIPGPVAFSLYNNKLNIYIIIKNGLGRMSFRRSPTPTRDVVVVQGCIFCVENVIFCKNIVKNVRFPGNHFSEL